MLFFMHPLPTYAMARIDIPRQLARLTETGIPNLSAQGIRDRLTHTSGGQGALQLIVNAAATRKNLHRYNLRHLVSADAPVMRGEVFDGRAAKVNYRLLSE